MATSRSLQQAPAFAAFAARGIVRKDAAARLQRAQQTLPDDQFRFAVETLVRTRLLTWEECIEFARLLRPENRSAE